MNQGHISEEGQKLTKAQKQQIRKAEKQRVREEKQQRAQRMKMLRWSILTLGVIIAVGGFIWLGGNDNEPGSGDAVSPTSLEIREGDHVRGARESGNVFVEYGDFQCPACGAAYPVVRSLEEEFGDRVAFVFRHFPLRQVHPHAQMAAVAAEAAGRQGRFWEMHDILFERQLEWSGEDDVKEKFVQYAEEIGLDQEQFERDLGDDALADRVASDYAGGSALGVTSTPTFFLNGENVRIRTFDELRDIVARQAGDGV